MAEQENYCDRFTHVQREKGRTMLSTIREAIAAASAVIVPMTAQGFAKVRINPST
jgi:hypothetical protein